MNHFIWNVDPVLFSIGNLSLRWYGLLFVSGFLTGFYIMRWIFTRERKDTADLDRWLLYIFIGAVIGARLGHCLFYQPEYYLNHPVEILFIWKGGLASHGGTVGVLIGTWLFSRGRAESYLWLLDRLAIPTALASALIRLGNLFNSEILGNPTSSMFGVIFSRVDNIPRHPAQLYEFLSYLLTFIVLLYIYKRLYNTIRDGLCLGVMMLLIFTPRFFIEMIKPEYADYDTGQILNIGQILSLPFILSGIFLIVRASTKGNN